MLSWNEDKFYSVAHDVLAVCSNKWTTHPCVSLTSIIFASLVFHTHRLYLPVAPKALCLKVTTKGGPISALLSSDLNGAEYRGLSCTSSDGLSSGSASLAPEGQSLSTVEARLLA